MTTCRVLTWNLWWRFGPWQARQPAIAQTLATEQPDVLTVQESWATAAGSQIEELGGPLGLTHTAFSGSDRSEIWQRRIAPDADGVEFGVAVASRWPLLEVTRLRLPAAPDADEGRTALGVVVDHPDGPLPVVTTHLTSHPTDSAVRIRQLDAVSLLAWDLRERAGPDVAGSGGAGSDGARPLPLIVTGDLNAYPDSDPIRRFAGVLTEPALPRVGFVDCWALRRPGEPGETWVTRNEHVVDWSPQARLDYVFIGVDDLGHRGVVGDVGLVGNGPAGGIWPSDHLGLRVDISPAQTR